MIKGRPPALSPELSQRIVSLHRHSGLGCRDIAQILEQAQVPAPFGGARWHPSTVSRALAKQGESLRLGRPRQMLPRLCSDKETPLHIITQMAWKRRAPGSGSELWRLLRMP